MFLRTLLLSFLLLVSIHSRLNAQIVATPSAGCAPLSVLLSGPPGASAVFWNLGGTAGTSTLTSPNPLYTQAGTYNITYSAIVNGSPVTGSYNLLVSQPPSGNFSFQMPQSHCKPVVVTFNASGGSPGSTYNWAFGDLSPVIQSSISPQSHTFTFKGSFVPVMTIVDAVTGCTAVATNGTGTVNVSDPPKHVVNSSNGFSGCAPPFTTSISGSLSTSGSPLGGSLNSAWQFNTGSPAGSTATDPGIISFAQGVHTITQVLTDNNQCSSTFTTLMHVVNPTLQATVNSLTVCAGQTHPPFNLTFSGSLPVTNWTVTNQPSPVSWTTIPNTVNHFTLMPWTAAGIQTITVSLQVPANCTPVVQTLTVFVEKVNADFLYTTTTTCQPSLAVSFTNNTTSNSGSSLSYTWYANAGMNAYNAVSPSSFIPSSGTVIPTFTLSQGSKNVYTKYKPFVPQISLVVASSNGCLSSFGTEPDTIQRPTAWFNLSKKKGCASFSVQIRDSSFHHKMHNIPISNYTFCNGASPPSFSAAISGSVIYQTFTYTNAGTYYPYIIVETQNGCIDTSFVDTVTMVLPPNIKGSVLPQPTVCVNQPVSIALNGTAHAVPTSSNIEHWHVESTNGFFWSCINDSTASYGFSQVGTQQFTVSAYHNGCQTSSALTQSITVVGPYAKFRHETTCIGNRKTVTFYCHLQEATSATLDFGDGSPPAVLAVAGQSSYSEVVTHTYPATGNYVAEIAAQSSITTCGQSTFSQTIIVRDPEARIRFRRQPLPVLPNPLACVRDAYHFDGLASVDADISCGRGYQWWLTAPDHSMTPYETDDRDTLMPIPAGGTVYVLHDVFAQDTFRIPGQYTITLRVKDVNNCVDYTSEVFRVSGVVPAFTLAPNPLCLSAASIQVQNKTNKSQVAPDVITNYTWTNTGPNFQFPEEIITSTDSTIQPVFNYSMVAPPFQVYTITCHAVNSHGCSGTTSKTLQVNNPTPNFQPSTGHPCIPLGKSAQVTFSARQGYATYSVSYDDPGTTWTSTGNFNNASHYFDTPGIYHPTLTVIDNGGCVASDVLTITALGQPTASYLFGNNQNKFCVPGTPTIISNSKYFSDTITEYLWTVGNVTSPPPGSPTLTTIFPKVGAVTVSLTVLVQGHCPSTFGNTVSIFPTPKAQAVIEKNRFCLGEHIRVSITDTNSVYNWKWFFGDNVRQDSVYAAGLFAKLNPTVSYNYSTFPTTGQNGFTNIHLLYYSGGFACYTVSTLSIQVIRVEAAFRQKDDIYAHCLNMEDVFNDLTPNPTSQNFEFMWDFAGASSAGANPVYTFPRAGVYPVTLNVTDRDFQCKGSATKNMTIFPLPTASLTVEENACPDAKFKVTAAGHSDYAGLLSATITPGVGSFSIQSDSTINLEHSAPETVTYSLTVTDINNCISPADTDRIFIQPPPPMVKWDTTVVVGQPVPLNAPVRSGFTYTWDPVVTALNCAPCLVSNPVSTTTANITYSVLVEDGFHCSTVRSTYMINVLPLTSIDVPSAFTPNGDGTNDLIRVDGWGIRKLNYFKIFNRWGQLVYQSNDLYAGWNGKFEGVEQNMETYIYQAEVETYTDEKLFKTGTFKLIR